MLSRRQLRVKVLKSLYAFFQGDKSDLTVAERELFRSIEKVHELYIYMLQFLVELSDADRNDADDLIKRFFPNEEELKASIRFTNLKFIDALRESKQFKDFAIRYKISWQKDQDLIRKIYLEIKKSPQYKEFLRQPEPNEKDFLVEVIRKFIESSEAMHHHIEEQSIFWSEEYEFIFQIMTRMIRTYYEKDQLEITSLYKDEEDDREFARILFTQTILNNKEFEHSISERTKNWEVERIALMDILILKMALAELTSFPGIPVKVTINEFIDISKEYSTPKSKQFVNGVIDKLTADYKEKGKIVKAGRGLIN